MRQIRIATAFHWLVASVTPALAQGPATSVDCCAAARKPIAAELLLVDLSINGQRVPDIATIEQQAGGRMLMDRQTWLRANLRPQASEHTLQDGASGFDLAAIPGVKLALDRSMLVLEVNAPASAFSTSSVEAGSLAAPLVSRPPLGWMVNYDVTAGANANSAAWRAAALEGLIVGPWGQFQTSKLISSGPMGRVTQRLETSWRLDNPEQMESLVIGDSTSVGGGWSRPVRFAGLRFGRDFTLRPGYVTQPGLNLTGEAALPSTVDVLVNNSRRLSAPVTPGPFDLRNVPPVNGAGEVNLVVRDLLGRETVTTQSFYASSRLLAQGLTDRSFELGWMRRGWGQDSSYADPFAAVTWRQGLSDRVTGELRAEAQRKRQAVGVDVTTLLGTWASVRGSLAHSQGSLSDRKDSGQLLQLGLERSALQHGFTIQWLGTTRGFSPFGEAADAQAASSRVRSQVLAGASRGMGRLRAGLSLARQSYWREGSRTSAGASLFMDVADGVSASLYGNRSLGQTQSWSAGLSISWRLGREGYTSSRATLQPHEPARVAVTAGASPPMDGGVGWRAEASNEAASVALGSLQWNASHAIATAELASSDRGEIASRLGVRGTVGGLGGVTYATRPVGGGSVAVVEAGVPGVTLLRSYQKVAVTDASGRAFIPDLAPWLPNRIELDVSDLPLDVSVGDPVQTVLPWARSGVLVRFDLRQERQAVLRLELPDGGVMPTGAVVRLLPSGAEFVVGLRGEAWLTGLQATGRQQIEVRWPQGRCELALAPLDPQDAAPTLGPLRCAGAK